MDDDHNDRNDIGPRRLGTRDIVSTDVPVPEAARRLLDLLTENSAHERRD